MTIFKEIYSSTIMIKLYCKFQTIFLKFNPLQGKSRTSVVFQAIDSFLMPRCKGISPKMKVRTLVLALSRTFQNPHCSYLIKLVIWSEIPNSISTPIWSLSATFSGLLCFIYYVLCPGGLENTAQSKYWISGPSPSLPHPSCFSGSG